MENKSSEWVLASKQMSILTAACQNPQKFKQALKDYMENKEIDYMESQAKERTAS